jgi:post-segregation antitoxin (ccd killing protein)
VDDAAKVRIEVELDKDLVDLATDAGVDLNELTDRALRRSLGAERLKTIPRYAQRMEQLQKQIRDEVAGYNALIEREGLFSGGEKESEEKARRWEEENAEAIRASNEELKRNGLWSDRYRLF